MDDQVKEVRIRIGFWDAYRLGAGFALGALLFPLTAPLVLVAAVVSWARRRLAG